MLRSRRIALIATIAVIGLSACGDAGSTTTAGKQPAVIHLGAASAGSGKIAAGASESADSMMMPYQDITYVFDGSYPDLGTSAPAWTLPGSPVVDQSRVADLAKLLGVEGDVRALTPEMGGGWMVGAEDYTTSNLTVAADGMASWWFNPAPMATSNVGVGCAAPAVEPAIAPDATSDTLAPDATMPVAPCGDVPTPPAGVPSKGEALTKATALFTDMGYDMSQFEFDTYADEWGANVTGFLMLGGHRSPITVSVGYGENGTVTWASGSLATPQEAGDYPLVSGSDALKRLNDQDGMWAMYGSPGMMAKGGAALDATTAIATREVSAGAPATIAVAETIAQASTPEPAPVDTIAVQPVIDPMPVDSLPPMEPITVHLNAMKLDLTMVWAEDGTIWLLPAYTFTAVNEGDFAGGQYTIIAVDDAFIDTPDPVTVDSAVPETALPVDTVAVPDTTISALEPTIAQAGPVLIGLTLDQATKVAEMNGWTVRVAVLDGEVQAGTMDLQPNRVNVAVEAGTVTSIDSIG
jgi:hypothetical protein